MSHIDDIRKDLEAAGIRVTTCKRLTNDLGHQVRCRGGEVINVYDSGKVSAQGKNQAAVKTALGLEGGPAAKKPTPVSRKVFVVYGHDNQARTQLEAMRQGDEGAGHRHRRREALGHLAAQDHQKHHQQQDLAPRRLIPPP